ncbi:hypothetical protein ALC53_03576 [Atta colombica]|uniref:Uncharacterized protein n=1 Tax=Atta colombica TaxID=520822 RepID=A0A151I5C1_9HYME|nr:hypothetical protein ALC53_03576 [Atta colombica]
MVPSSVFVPFVAWSSGGTHRGEEGRSDGNSARRTGGIASMRTRTNERVSERASERREEQGQRKKESTRETNVERKRQKNTRASVHSYIRILGGARRDARKGERKRRHPNCL